MQRQRPIGAQVRSASTCNQPLSWENFDPRVDAFFSSDNRYHSGPGALMPTEQQPYSIRTNNSNFKIFIGGIHPHTTAEGIENILSNYGRPISVERKKSKRNEVIAFAEFRTQGEAENAIICLDGKKPLKWSVKYAYTHGSGDRFVTDLEDSELENEIESQRLLFPPEFSEKRTFRPSSSSIRQAPTKASAQLSNIDLKDYPPCTVCKMGASKVCTVCRTRYCSQECQDADWQDHRLICRPPPPLELAGPTDDPRLHQLVQTTANVSLHEVNVPFVHKPTSVPIRDSSSAVSRGTGSTSRSNHANDLASSHKFVVEGIHPLDKIGTRQNEPPLPTRHYNSPNQIRNINQPEKEDLSSMKPDRSFKLSSSEKISDCNNSTHSSSNHIRSPKWISPRWNNLSPRQKNNSPPRFSHNEHREFQESKSRNFAFRQLNSSELSPNSTTTNSTRNPTPQPEVKMYAKTYPKPPSHIPNLNKRLQVCVCFSKSPEEFFVQYVHDRKDLMEMSAEIQRCALDSDPVVDPVLGAPCLAAYVDDQQWYRAQIIKTFTENELGVRFIDYGNTSKMPNTPRNFRKLEIKFAKYPGFAVKVKLADILPPNGSTWVSPVIQEFAQLVDEKQFMMEPVRSDGDVMCVRLKTLSGQDLACELVNKGLAKLTTQEFVSSELDPMSALPSSHSPVPPPPQVAQKPLIPSTKLSSKLISVSSSESCSVQVGTRDGKITSTSTSTTKIHVLEETERRDNKPQVTFSSLGPAEKPDHSSRGDHSETHQLSSATQKSKQSKETTNSVLKYVRKDSEVILVVTEQLNNGCVGMLLPTNEYARVLEYDSECKETPTQANFDPPVHSIVSAFSEQHNSWFRGYVFQKHKPLYEIFYVDFGNFESMVKKVKPVLTDFDLPELAVKVTFSDSISPSNLKRFRDKMSNESSHYLKVETSNDHECYCCLTDESGEEISVTLEPWTSILRNRIIAPNWESGSLWNVRVVMAENIDRIFVQLASQENAENLMRIETQLYECSQRLFERPPFSSLPLIGTYVAARFPEDGGLYRAKILEYQDDSINVEYIDYGNSCLVSVNDIRPLPDELYTYPTCGNFISLGSVQRIDVPLPEQVKAILNDCVEKECSLFVSFSDGRKMECTLTKNGVMINEQINEVLQSLSQSEATPLSDNTDNTLGDFKYDDGPFLNLPDEGPFEAIVLSADDPRNILICLDDDSVLKKLSALQVEIQSYANSIIRGYSPSLSEVFLARSPTDGFWYRATCLDTLPSNCVDDTVFMCLLVDYGEIFTTNMHAIRRIPKRFVQSIPYLAAQAMLKETEEIEGDLDQKLISRFQELLPKQKQIVARVLHQNGIAFVIDIPDVGKTLVEEGLL